MSRLRIGVIGLGLIAQVAHLPNLVRLSRSFAVTHVSDLSAPLMAAVTAGLPGSPRTSREWRAVVEDREVDALLVLTPGAHGPIVRAALEAGKHVLSEKPLCVTRQEARDIERIAREGGRVLQVAYMKAYDPGVAAAAALLEGIGPLRLVSVEVRHPTHESQIERLEVLPASAVDADLLSEAHKDAEAATRVALGTAPAGIAHLYREILLGSVIHELSAIRALGLPVPQVWQHVEAWPFDPHAVDAGPPSLAATAQLTRDLLLRLQWLWLPDYPRYEETISVVGVRGALHLDMPQPYGPNVSASLRLRSQDGSDTQLLDGRHRRGSGFLEELRSFHAAVTAGAPVPTGAAAALEDVASLQAFTATLAAAHGIHLAGEAGAALPEPGA